MTGARSPGAVGRGWLVLRIGLGLLILGTGVGKALDLPGFVRVMETYGLLAPALLSSVAVAITASELVLGVWLISGWRPATALLAAIAVNLGYAVLLSLTLARGLDLKNCGCFGVFLARPLRWFSPLEDLAFAGLAWLLYRRVSSLPWPSGVDRRDVETRRDGHAQ
jgi:uncharacterized membrane protein YphA (DoxX/SURF4 family)